ncbi:MAG: serine/threonine-protein kinase [Pseudomonadota bacterium]
MSGGYAYDRDEAERASGHGLRVTRRGEVLGDTYRLLEIVGGGGMAEVYSAEHLRLGRKFAVKVLRAGTNHQSLERFRREASAIARIDNEFVVGVMDCGEAGDGTPYLVMDLLQGEDLRSLLDREGALPIPRAVNFVWEACQGIAAVHAAGLVHRDLKPENLYVSKRATGQDWCRVLDFGIAKTDVSNSTAEGALIGTVRYMAPEQLQDASSAGPTVDIYALGAVLYECVTGRSPHRGDTVQELMFKILNEQSARLESRRPGVPKGLANAVERALAKSPTQRFADVRQFANAIAVYARLSSIDDREPRAATVELESDGDTPSATPRTGRIVCTAIALSGIIGLGVGVSLHEPATVASANAPMAPDASKQCGSVTSASATASAPSSVPLALSASVPASSSVPTKAHANGAVRHTPMSSRARFDFDSENPYDR